MAGSGRHGADERLAATLAAGASIVDAAAAVGVNERTVRRRLDEPDFRKLLDGMKAEAIRLAVARLTADMGKAAGTLAGLLDSSDERVRLSAGRAVLEFGIKGREALELEPLVAELTEVLEQLKSMRAEPGK
jgi:hypothetical protein